MSLLQGRTALVTGGTRGIGEAVARRLLHDGARVLVTGTSDNSTPPEGTELLVADFGDSKQIEDFSERVKHLKIDVLINNAGINKISPFEKIEVADFERIQRVNLHAPFRLCQAVIPHMGTAGWGRIVNISSIFSVISKEQRGSYSASKFALDGMTLALALELAPCGILANCVAPGFIDTELTQRILGRTEMEALAAKIPVGRLGKPAEVAELVAWLASPSNTYLTGQNILIDGGISRA